MLLNILVFNFSESVQIEASAIALKYPLILSYLPQILPKHFKKMLFKVKESTLENLQKVLKCEPWVLGLGQVFKT